METGYKSLPKKKKSPRQVIIPKFFLLTMCSLLCNMETCNTSDPSNTLKVTTIQYEPMFQKDLILFGATVYCQMKGSLLYELSQNGQTFQILVFNIQILTGSVYCLN